MSCPLPPPVILLIENYWKLTNTIQPVQKCGYFHELTWDLNSRYFRIVFHIIRILSWNYEVPNTAVTYQIFLQNKYHKLSTAEGSSQKIQKQINYILSNRNAHYLYTVSCLESFSFLKEWYDNDV
jgi:hypothetical protein